MRQGPHAAEIPSLSRRKSIQGQPHTHGPTRLHARPYHDVSRTDGVGRRPSTVPDSIIPIFVVLIALVVIVLVLAVALVQLESGPVTRREQNCPLAGLASQFENSSLMFRQCVPMSSALPPSADSYFQANTGCSSPSTGSCRPSRHSHRSCNRTAPVGAWMRSLPNGICTTGRGLSGMAMNRGESSRKS